MQKEEQMRYHEMQAYWWMHSASNGHATTRTISKGIDGPKMTAEELRDDAMSTSKRHMQLFRECAENRTS